MCVRECVRPFLCVFAYVFAWVCVRACVRACVCICVCGWEGKVRKSFQDCGRLVSASSSTRLPQ